MKLFSILAIIHKHKKLKKILLILLILFAVWMCMFLIIPRSLFPESYSSLLYSSEGNLLGARIAPDGQWRFPPAKTLPPKFIKCLLTYEDKRFYWHPGIDIAALARALYIDIKAHKVVSGGSTITMQLARIARENQDRTLYEKAIEGCWALFIESTHSKKSILNLYASHAQGNTFSQQSQHSQSKSNISSHRNRRPAHFGRGMTNQHIEKHWNNHVPQQ